MGKIVTQKQALAIRQKARRHGAKVVFTNGCFDILHRGHVECLAKAKKLGDILIVGLNSDASVRRLKGPGRPIFKLRDRAIMLSYLSSVDYVTVFNALTPERLIKKLLPDVLVKGADYHAQSIVGAADVLAAGGKVVTIPLVAGRSSSAIISRLKCLR